MKIKKKIAVVWLVAAILTSCVPAAKVAPTETAALRWGISTDNWKEYSSKFTSDVGTIEYTLLYPPAWYIYPGSTRIDLRLAGQTYIQSFARTLDNNSGYPVTGEVQLAVNALPCAIIDNNCDTKGLPILASNLPGKRQIDVYDDWTVWSVYLYTKDYSISLEGRMSGSPDKNNDNIEILDRILSTVVVK